MTAALARDGDASQEAEGEGPSAADNYRCVVDTVRPTWHRLQNYTKGYTFTNTNNTCRIIRKNLALRKRVGSFVIFVRTGVDFSFRRL